jgi:F0F1-type ATP synthase assembly protein I
MKGKPVLWAVCSISLIRLLVSCVSIQDRAMSSREREEATIVGSVTVDFNSFQIFFPNKNAITNKAYAELKKEAGKKYQGNIDIRNIVISGSFSPLELLNIGGGILVGVGMGYVFSYAIPSEDAFMGPGMSVGLLIAAGTNTQKITATGDVVEYSSVAGSSRNILNNLQGAMAKISEDLIETLPARARVAVLSVGSSNRTLSENAVDELEFNLVDTRKFTIVDRARLDQIRREQNFQMSGDVSDDSAVSIGNMLGADIVIVGTINTTDSGGRITIRALDVQTAQIVTMAREQF